MLAALRNKFLPSSVQVTASVPDPDVVTLPWQSLRRSVIVKVGRCRIRLLTLPAVVEWNGSRLRAVPSSHSQDALFRIPLPENTVSSLQGGTQETAQGDSHCHAQWRIQVVRPGWSLANGDYCWQGSVPASLRLRDPDKTEVLVTLQPVRRGLWILPTVVLLISAVLLAGIVRRKSDSNSLAVRALPAAILPQPGIVSKAADAVTSAPVSAPATVSIRTDAGLQIDDNKQHTVTSQATGKTQGATEKSVLTQSAEQRLAQAALVRTMQQPLNPKLLNNVARLRAGNPAQALPKALQRKWQSKVQIYWQQKVSDSPRDFEGFGRLRQLYIDCLAAMVQCSSLPYFDIVSSFATGHLVRLRALARVNPQQAAIMARAILRILPTGHPLLTTFRDLAGE